MSLLNEKNLYLTCLNVLTLLITDKEASSANIETLKQK